MKHRVGVSILILVGLPWGCSEGNVNEDESRIGQPCGDEGYPVFCETEQVLIECYKCNDFTSNTCWKKIGCGPEYKCRYLITQGGGASYEAARCMEPTDPRYPLSTSSPQTFEK